MRGLAWLLLALGPGCYLQQAAFGQLELVQKAEPIERAFSHHPDAETRRLLHEVGPILRFGHGQGLARTQSYRRFVELDRDAVVYVVTASAPLAFAPRIFWFPIVGSFTYLGWFDRGDADRFGAALAEEGLDVDVRGAGAYSTLGILEDPVISTMLSRGPTASGELANLLLHESTHATVYVAGQSTFSESLADFVGDELALEYLGEAYGPRSAELSAFRDLMARGEARVRRLHEAYGALAELYASTRSDAEKLAEKARIIDALERELRLRRRPNNAMLIQYRTYAAGRAAFERLYRRCGGHMRPFLAAVATLAPGDFPGPQSEDFDPIVDRLTCQ